MLRKFSQKVKRIKQVHVFLEVVRVPGVEQHLPFERLVADLLQRQRRPGNVLRKTLLALRIGEPYGVVDTEPGVAPGQEVPRKVLGKQFLLYQKPDQAPAEHFQSSR